MSIIINIYRHRPIKLAHMGFGRWFCNAFELPDTKLYDMVEINEVLEHINNNGYDVLPHTNLVAYNDFLAQS